LADIRMSLYRDVSCSLPYPALYPTQYLQTVGVLTGLEFGASPTLSEQSESGGWSGDRSEVLEPSELNPQREALLLSRRYPTLLPYPTSANSPRGGSFGDWGFSNPASRTPKERHSVEAVPYPTCPALLCCSSSPNSQGWCWIGVWSLPGPTQTPRTVWVVVDLEIGAIKTSRVEHQKFVILVSSRSRVEKRIIQYCSSSRSSS